MLRIAANTNGIAATCNPVALALSKPLVEILTELGGFLGADAAFGEVFDDDDDAVARREGALTT